MLTWLTPYRILTLWVHRCSPSNFITRHLSIGEILYRQASVHRRDTLPTSICVSERHSTDKYLPTSDSPTWEASMYRRDTLPTSIRISGWHSTDKHLCIGEILSDILCLPTQRNISREIFLWALYKWDMISMALAKWFDLHWLVLTHCNPIRLIFGHF